MVHAELDRVSLSVCLADSWPGMWRLHLLSLGIATSSPAQCRWQTERLMNLTAFPHYDNGTRPYMYEGQPVNISVQLYIAAIQEVDQKGQQLALEGYFRWRWIDPRLAHR